jgi:hypothetical protein
VAASNVLDERLPGGDDPGAAVLLGRAHRVPPRRHPGVVALDAGLAARSLRCHAAGSSAASTAGSIGAWPVVTLGWV